MLDNCWNRIVYKSLSYILCWFINFTFKTSIIHPLFDSAIPEKLNSKLILRLWTKFRIKIEIFIEWKLLILQQNWPNKMWFINFCFLNHRICWKIHIIVLIHNCTIILIILVHFYNWFVKYSFAVKYVFQLNKQI